MENQNVQWDNWNTPTYDPTDAEVSKMGENTLNIESKFPQYDWSSPEDSELPTLTRDSPSSNNLNLEDKKYTTLESIPKINIHTPHYKFKFDSHLALENINNLNLSPKYGDNAYDFNPGPNTEVGNIIKEIVKLGIEQSLKVTDCYICKINPNESVLNLSPSKSKFIFLYYIESDYESGDIIMDLTSIGGPPIMCTPPKSNELIMLPGWIPLKIRKNKSNKEIIIIVSNLD